MTVLLPPEITSAGDAANPIRHNFGFMAQLMRAWIAEKVRTPATDWVRAA